MKLTNTEVIFDISESLPELGQDSRQVIMESKVSILTIPKDY